MAIDFTLAPEHAEIRDRVRAFIDDVVKPAMEPYGPSDDMEREVRRRYVSDLLALRGVAREQGLWLPHMPQEWGGMGLGHVELAMVQAEAAKARVRPVGAQLPWRPTRATCTRCCTGAPTSRRRSTSSRCATASDVVVLRHDRARGRRLATRR